MLKTKKNWKKTHLQEFSVLSEILGIIISENVFSSLSEWEQFKDDSAQKSGETSQYPD